MVQGVALYDMVLIANLLNRIFLIFPDDFVRCGGSFLRAKIQHNTYFLIYLFAHSFTLRYNRFMDFMKYDDGCGRYALSASSSELKKRYNLAKVPSELPKSFDIKPGQTLPVVVESEDGKPQLELMTW